MCIAVGNTLEAVTGVFLLRNFIGDGEIFRRVNNIIKFAVITLCMCLVSSGVGALSLFLFRIVSGEMLGQVWFTWWLGDVSGILVLTPLLMGWTFRGPWNLSWRRWIELIGLMIAIPFMSRVIFGDWRLYTILGSQRYLLIPILLWIALRFDQRVVVTAVGLLSLSVVWNTVQTPLMGRTLNESLLLLQLFVCVMAITLLLLSAALAERKRIEELILQKNRELERSNIELERFAYIASHDLKEPLQTALVYTQFLQERYRAKLDERGQECIHFIIDSVRRMNRLIEDLLSYSKVRKEDTKFASVNIASVCDQAIANLKVAIDQNGALVSSDPLPVVFGHEAQLLQVFQNLIANAVKFHREEIPRVHIGCQHQGHFFTFAIRDNGIGIKPEHTQFIFEIFKRLHSQAQYPGTGIGLALCKKIIEQHGGKIWVVSEYGRGSTFYFSLPAGPAARLVHSDSRVTLKMKRPFWRRHASSSY